MTTKSKSRVRVKIASGSQIDSVTLTRPRRSVAGAGLGTGPAIAFIALSVTVIRWAQPASQPLSAVTAPTVCDNTVGVVQVEHRVCSSGCYRDWSVGYRDPG